MALPVPADKHALLAQHADATQLWQVLSLQERAAVLAYARGIDMSRPGQVIHYAAAEQGRLSTWLDVAVASMARAGQAGDGRSVDALLTQLKTWDALCAPRRFFRGGASLRRLRTGYARMSPLIDELAGKLMQESIALRKTSKILARMETENEEHLARLTTYWLCGKARLKLMKDEQAKRIAQTPQDPLTEPGEIAPAAPGQVAVAEAAMPDVRASDAQALQRRLDDLLVTRQMALQMRVQLALLLEGNREMVLALDRALRHTLPLWKTQVMLTLGLAAQAQARQDAERINKTFGQGAGKRSSWLKWLLRRMPDADRAALRANNGALLASLTEAQGDMTAQHARAEMAAQVTERAPTRL